MITINLNNKTWIPPKDYILILKGMTEKEYWEFSSEDLKVEYSQGCLFIHSPASIKHEKIFSFLHRFINDYLEKKISYKAGYEKGLDLPIYYTKHANSQGMPILQIADYFAGSIRRELGGLPNSFYAQLKPKIKYPHGWGNIKW